MSTASRIGIIDFSAASASKRERRSMSKMRDRGASAASTCSNLNFSAQAMTGRHTSRSMSTMTPIMVASPARMARVLPALAAVWR